MSLFDIRPPTDAQEHEAAKNYSLIAAPDGARTLAKTWKERAADNITAIRLAQRIESEFRPATDQEKEKLIRFTGFGASDLANGLFPVKGHAFRKGWEELGHALHAVAGAEAAALARGTQYAHFTPEFMVSAVWHGLARLGFAGGRVLEPGCGSGLFFALAPGEIAAACQFVGVERDPITARIASLLYPQAEIRCLDFTRSALLPGEQFDLVIGNPPFSDRSVRADGDLGELGLSLHDFFIARSLRALRPGGLAAFVVSRYTMDKAGEDARREIDAHCDLIGAVRMPERAMRASSGTDVVVDVLFFRRRSGAVACAAAKPWITHAGVECEGLATRCDINRYFRDYPDQVLGRHAYVSSRFGPAYTCLPYPGLDVAQELFGAVATICAEPLTRAPAHTEQPAVLNAASGHEEAAPDVDVRKAADGGTIREGSYFVDCDALWQIVDGRPARVAVKEGRGGDGIFQSHALVIRGLIPIRDAARALLRAQAADAPSWTDEAAALSSAYQAFVGRHGPVNKTIVTSTMVDVTVVVKDDDGAVVSERVEQRERTTSRRPNLAPFLDDPDVWLVAAVENYDVDTGAGTPGPIFTQRVIRPPAAPVIASASDALAVVLNDIGRVDIPALAGLLGVTEEQAVADLGSAIFEDPETNAWATSDAYLSGAVRTKLLYAKAAVEDHGERFARNVRALEAVQPADLRPSEITARLGAPWVPVDVVEAFILAAMRIRTKVFHTADIASWTVHQGPFRGNAAGTSEWGTTRRHAGDLLEDALNSSIPRIYDIERTEHGETRVFNPVATEAAKEKLEKIKRAFESWVWREPARADRLVRLYNDEYNNLVPRHFDGSHLRLPGASSIVSMRAHQKRGIWRGIAAGSSYLAQSVGSGKTYIICAMLMEQKRLGMISKPMMVVPGHCLAQAAREFLMLYPTARILVADEQNFARDKRQRFIARAATGDWDCIIITHSAFKFIPAPGEFEREMISEQIGIFEEMLLSVDGDDRVSRKRLERLKEGFEEKMDRLKSRKDDVVTIEEIGVDQIVVDECQEFRKLSFSTNMSSLRGIDADGSQRAWDLYVKVKFIDRLNPGRAIMLASGTPITNTMGEMFTLLRFMAEAGLVDRKVHQFDAWASTFGETRTDLELQPSGLYKPATRFSQFINVPELISMFRSVADVVLKDDLRSFMTLPKVKGGKRQIVTAAPSQAFRAYQKTLAARIVLIEQRKGPPKKGDDIILSVIGDGRHAALDMRFAGYEHNEPDNKLNALVANAFRIWQETSACRYVNPATGEAYPLPGAAQMIFSDLGTLNAERTRGFSAYAWIRDELVRLGVPADQIAIMQHYKKSAAKLALFADVNSGRKRFLIGSSETMGTGVNAQQRLKALHHLDVPWLPSWIEQREGRIERQGNQNEEIELYAYATTGSMDATMWQTNERKARFISAALAGDKSIRRLDDVGDTVDQFAFAKALSSGDPRLMQKAGLEAEIARLRRLRDAHFDDQYSVRSQVEWATGRIARQERLVPLLRADIDRRVDTRADLFAMTVGDKIFAERKEAGAACLAQARSRKLSWSEGEWVLGEVAGFRVRLEGVVQGGSKRKEDARWTGAIWLEMASGLHRIETDVDMLEPLGLVSRLENAVRGLDIDLARALAGIEEAKRDLADFSARLSDRFDFEDELTAKTDEILAINESLARNTDGEPCG